VIGSINLCLSISFVCRLPSLDPKLLVADLNFQLWLYR
jgi:hypothetical protein